MQLLLTEEGGKGANFPSSLALAHGAALTEKDRGGSGKEKMTFFRKLIDVNPIFRAGDVPVEKQPISSHLLFLSLFAPKKPGDPVLCKRSLRRVP